MEQITETAASLRKWGKALDEEMAQGLGASLIRYADAWEKEVAELEFDKVRRYKANSGNAAIMDAHAQVARDKQMEIAKLQFEIATERQKVGEAEITILKLLACVKHSDQYRVGNPAYEQAEAAAVAWLEGLK